MSDHLPSGLRGPFRAAVTGFVPEAGDLSEKAWEEGESLVGRLLLLRPPAERRQVRLLVRALDGLSVLRYGRRLARLHPDRRERFLLGLQDAPVLLVRRGVWGLRTLAFLLVYGTSEGRSAVGYRAHPAGWDAPGIDRPAPPTPAGDTRAPASSSREAP